MMNVLLVCAALGVFMLADYLLVYTGWFVGQDLPRLEATTQKIANWCEQKANERKTDLN